jgi:hypothetical protein
MIMNPDYMRYITIAGIYNGCKVNVDYVPPPPDDGLVRAETYMGVKE